MCDLDELIRLIKVSISSPPHRSSTTTDANWHWRIAMPRIMSSEEQLYITQNLDLTVGKYAFSGNTDNSGKTQVIKIYVN